MSSDKQQKKSKNIKGTGSSKSSASQNIPTSKIITVGDREYITYPKLIKEQKAIFASQVMIPSLLSGTNGPKNPKVFPESREGTII